MANDIASFLVHRARSIDYRVSGDAPDDWQRLCEQTARDGFLTVWNGASDQTIYGSAEANWAFRAWHDTTHLNLDADFSLQGETVVAHAQAAEAGEHGGLILADVLGQALYYDRWGRFPENQIAFVVDYMADAERALSRPGY